MPSYAFNYYTTVNALNAGDFVVAYLEDDLPPDFYPPAFITKVEKAVIAPYKFIIGYVTQAYGPGSNAKVYSLGGVNYALSGLVPGDSYYSDPTTPGAVTNVMPVGTEVIQRLGIALSSIHLDTMYNGIMDGTAGGGSVLSVTGLDTDNTDPANPVVQISVDGISITGDGTPGNPLVSAGGAPSGPAGGDLSGNYPNPGVVWANGYGTYDLRYPQLLGAYADPTWITSLAWSKITGAPSFLTQAYTNIQSNGGAVTQRSILNFSTEFTTVDNGGATRTDVSVNSVAWSKITSTPTTLAGYGITDGVATSRTLTINGSAQDLSADRTWNVGTVTSVGLTAPSELSVASSPVTGSGTIALSWASQLQNLVFASPNGAPGTPAFRALVAADIPALSYVTSVGLSLPSEFSVSGSPVTGAGTLTGSWASQAANLVFASPNGAPGTPSFRALVAGDIPALSYVPTSRQLTINGSAQDLSADRSWSVGTVTSVGGTGTVSGLTLTGTVTGSGNITLGGTLSLTSGDVTTGLGYTPLNPANNLSEVASDSAARTNLSILDVYLTGDQSTSSNVASNITELVWSGAANTRYKFWGLLATGCNGAGGVKYQVTVPAGATLKVVFFGITTSNTAFTSTNTNASATLTAAAFVTFNSANGWVLVQGEIATAGTSGNIQFGFASNTNLQTSTIYKLGTHLTVITI